MAVPCTFLALASFTIVVKLGVGADTAQCDEPTQDESCHLSGAANKKWREDDGTNQTARRVGEKQLCRQVGTLLASMLHDFRIRTGTGI